VAAERWKTQINQNALQPASYSEQPNASHNEAVAWDASVNASLQGDAIVFLRHAFEDPRVSTRIALLEEHLRGRLLTHTIHGKGESRMAVLMDLVTLGDFVSLYMAVENGVDPGSNVFISETLKDGLEPPPLSISGATSAR
jgi:glucose/mannose-6-phosphate isomerase